MGIFKKVTMSGIKPFFTTLLFTSIPLYLESVTPIFASLTAIIGTFYTFFKGWNEFNKWLKERDERKRDERR